VKVSFSCAVKISSNHLYTLLSALAHGMMFRKRKLS